jgi:hypothetical protein
MSGILPPPYGLHLFRPGRVPVKMVRSEWMVGTHVSPRETAPRSSSSPEEIHHCNLLMARNSLEQVFSNTAESLQAIERLI